MDLRSQRVSRARAGRHTVLCSTLRSRVEHRVRRCRRSFVLFSRVNSLALRLCLGVDLEPFWLGAFVKDCHLCSLSMWRMYALALFRGHVFFLCLAFTMALLHLKDTPA